jgi:hypothetical protein
MPEWQRRILSTFAVRSRPIAHGYDPLTGRPIRVLRIGRQLPVSGKTGMFDFAEAARSRLDIWGSGTSPASHRHGWRRGNEG